MAPTCACVCAPFLQCGPSSVAHTSTAEVLLQFCPLHDTTALLLDSSAVLMGKTLTSAVVNLHMYVPRQPSAANLLHGATAKGQKQWQKHWLSRQPQG